MPLKCERRNTVMPIEPLRRRFPMDKREKRKDKPRGGLSFLRPRKKRAPKRPLLFFLNANGIVFPNILALNLIQGADGVGSFDGNGFPEAHQKVV